MVSDVKRSINFYNDALGCSVDRERPDLGLYHLRAGTAFINLPDIHGKLGTQSFGSRKAEDRNVDHNALNTFSNRILALTLRHLRLMWAKWFKDTELLVSARQFTSAILTIIQLS